MLLELRYKEATNIDLNEGKNVATMPQLPLRNPIALQLALSGGGGRDLMSGLTMNQSGELVLEARISKGLLF